MAASTIPTDGSIHKVEISLDGGSTWNLLGYQKEVSLNVSTDMREITSKTQCNFREKVPTVSNWTISGTAEVMTDETDGKNIKTMIGQLRNTIDLRIHPIDCAGDEITGELTYYGSGHFSTLDVSFPEKDTATYNYTFEGSGELTVEEVV
jgi:hypothetical protein